jgi:hypothetical protein
MWTSGRPIIALAAVCAATVPAWPQAALYDIRAELVYQPQSSLYAVQIRNVGPTIPGPVRAEFHLLLPAGLSLTSWTLNGMSCAPGPPKSGPQDITCSRVLNAAWTAGTILSNQIFFVTKPPLGTRPPRVCVRALLQLPKPPSGTCATAAETCVANNSFCV